MATRTTGGVVTLVLQVLGLALAALAALALTLALTAALVAWFTGHPVLSHQSLFLGIVCALIVWLIAAAFHFKKETVTLAVSDRRFFLDRVAAQLEGLGYEITQRSDNEVASWPPVRSLLVGGGINVMLGPEAARLSGPKVYVELLRRRLRVDNFIDRFQRDFLDHKRREGERLLRRVQVCLEVSADQWQDVHDKILTRLEHEGATVHCHINILAQSEHGMRDSIVELGVQDWLRKHGIKAEVHREGMRAGDSSVQHTPEVPAEPATPAG